jgi:hypothetical protein
MTGVTPTESKDHCTACGGPCRDESSEIEDWPTGEQFAELAADVLNEWLPGYHQLNGRSWRIRRTDRGWEAQDENSNELWEFDNLRIATHRF